MKRILATILAVAPAFAADTFLPLILNSDLTLPTWGTNFFTANAGYIPASGAATTIATNGGTGWGTTLISPYSSGGTNSTPVIFQPTLYDDITLAELTASRVLTTDASKILSASSVTATELGYLSGVTSAVQTQLDAKAPLVSPSFTAPALGVASATSLSTTGSIDLGNSDTTLARSAAGTLSLEGVPVLDSAVGTLAYSGTTVTLTAGKGIAQEDILTCTNDATLAWTGLAAKDGGTIYVAPAATNCTFTLPSYAYGPSGTTLTITGGTGNTNHTIIAWVNTVIGGTNRVSVNALNYCR